MRRIALIHALEESVAPARAAFAELWPDAYCFDLLETSLAVDRAAAGQLNEGIKRRIRALADYATASEGYAGQTSAILFTCSAFGPAIDAVKTSSKIPVLRPNEAGFAEALADGSRFLLAVTFEPSRASLEAELRMMAADMGKSIELHSLTIEGALDALKSGNAARHDQLVAEAVAKYSSNVDAVILGQFSLARSKHAIQVLAPGLRVVTTPHSAVTAIRRLTE